jgi:hypothetical protein
MHLLRLQAEKRLHLLGDRVEAAVREHHLIYGDEGVDIPDNVLARRR